MLKIEYIDTNELTGLTDVKYIYKKLGKSEVTETTFMACDRWAAVSRVRQIVNDYFRTNVEVYINACRNTHELNHERWSESKERAWQVCDRYHRYLFTEKYEYPECLQFYLRIRGEFRRILPPKTNSIHHILERQVKLFEELAEEFFIEFTSGHSKLMAKYQPQQKTEAKAS